MKLVARTMIVGKYNKPSVTRRHLKDCHYLKGKNTRPFRSAFIGSYTLCELCAKRMAAEIRPF